MRFNLKFIKKNWNWILLVLILLFGFYLRSYHIDYPVIGYHNWKETHYLTEARNFAEDGFFQHGFFVPEHDYPIIGRDASGAHSDTFPVTSILIGFIFMIFGSSLFLARLVVILFGIGSILMMYLLVKALFNNSLLAITATALTAITPLFVFFTRNVQLMSPGIFFMLSAAYFYVIWINNERPKYIILATLFLTLTFLTKYPFLVIAIPMAAIFPFERLKQIKKYMRELLISLFIGSFALIWFLYSNILVAKKFGGSGVTSSLIDISVIFSSQWWSPIKSYIADNYTFIGLFFALVGFFVLFIVKQKKIAKKFMIGYYVGFVLFLLIMGKKLQGHSYHQFPIAPLIIISAAFGIVFLAAFVSSFFKKIFIKNEKIIKLINYFIVLLLFITVLIPSLESKNRQFDTQFIGLDVAGEFIKSHAKTGERMVNSGHQDYGVLWHADMKGVKGVINSDLSYLKRAEKELNVNWLFIYKWGFSVMNDAPKWEYIQNNYDLTQFGFITQGNSNQPLYLVLRKGGNFNFSNINKILEQKLTQKKKYEYTFGEQTLYYINLI